MKPKYGQVWSVRNVQPVVSAAQNFADHTCRTCPAPTASRKDTAVCNNPDFGVSCMASMATHCFDWQKTGHTYLFLLFKGMVSMVRERKLVLPVLLG